MIPDESFERAEHLLKSKDFNKVYKKGRCFKKDNLALYCLQNDLTHNRIGFSIASRNFKLANKRNRIRRLLREIYRRGKKHLKSGFDIIIVAKKDFAHPPSYGEAEVLFSKLIENSDLLA